MVYSENIDIIPQYMPPMTFQIVFESTFPHQKDETSFWMARLSALGHSGRWIRKAALGDSPVDCRNRRGFSAEKRIHCTGTEAFRGGESTRDILLDGSSFCAWASRKVDSKGGSWRQSGGLSQPPWLFRRKANPPSPTRKTRRRLVSRVSAFEYLYFQGE